MKTALYIRVSTDEQAREGYSIQAQKNKLEAYCISQGWDVVGIYVDDGYSAKDLNRPEMKRMIKHIKEGIIRCVLVYRLDRLTRSVLDLYKLLELFEEHGCKFKSATEVYDTTTAMGRMFITIVAALAQWERENLAERVRMGLQEKARQGKWPNNIPPFGYEIDRKTDKLFIIEKEAEIVRKIFDMYLSGLGMNSIAVELNKLNLHTKAGSPWNINAIQYILTNPIYYGTMRYNYTVNTDNYFEVENAAPAIISRETFEKVQRIRERRRKNHPKTATSDYIFSGTIKCARCGSPLFGKYGFSRRGEKTYRNKQYLCTNQRKGLCNLPYISERFLEQRFLEYIQKIHIEENLIGEFSDITEQTKMKIEFIKNELRAVERRREKWQYAWANEKISDEDFSKRMKEENDREKKLKEELKTLHANQKTSFTKDELLQIVKNIRLNWEHMEPIEKKTFLQMFVRKISVDKIGKGGKAEHVQIKEIVFY